MRRPSGTCDPPSVGLETPSDAPCRAGKPALGAESEQSVSLHVGDHLLRSSSLSLERLALFCTNDGAGCVVTDPHSELSECDVQVSDELSADTSEGGHSVKRRLLLRPLAVGVLADRNEVRSDQHGVNPWVAVDDVFDVLHR